MTPNISFSKASNWVDRGEPANAKVRHVLAHYFERFDASDEAWLEEHAVTLIAMVAADCTERQLSMYLRAVVRETGSPTREPLGTPAVAVSIWHIAKAALVRDFAERVLRGDIPANNPTPDALSHWMASRLLSPEELKEHEARPANPYADDEPFFKSS